MATLTKLKTTRRREQQLEQLSPFELKDNLITLASDRQRKPARAMLNAGRGNPNWTATLPREAFYTLGQFGVAECRRVMEGANGLAGIPHKEGIAKRFEKFLKSNNRMPGAELLADVYNYGVRQHGFDADEWVHEMTEGITGDQYPTPDRMLTKCEAVVHDYLVQEMCDGKSPRGKYDLFATEGGTAAMCYLFDSLLQNSLLKKGDRIALGVPAFTPYLEIPHLDRYDFKVTYIHGSGRDADGNPNFQYPDQELDKLGDKSIKAFFITNPSNPTSVEMAKPSRKYLVDVVKKQNPNLMILTDDVYGTFVPGFTSLMKDLPQNTLCVYSFSKYFGATGWRLGVIALHQDNIYDKMIAALPQREKKRLAKLYESLTIYPEKLKFIDRMVADSRQVALNHTAGLSTPQQIQMMLFAAFALIDRENTYKSACRELISNRYRLLWEGLELPVYPDPDRAAYYCIIDVKEWALKNHGRQFFSWMEKNFEPVDIVFRLAEECSVVLLNGGGFAGPEWSVRVSLANLDENDYSMIGRILSVVMNEYVEGWQASDGPNKRSRSKKEPLAVGVPSSEKTHAKSIAQERTARTKPDAATATTGRTSKTVKAGTALQTRTGRKTASSLQKTSAASATAGKTSTAGNKKSTTGTKASATKTGAFAATGRKKTVAKTQSGIQNSTEAKSTAATKPTKSPTATKEGSARKNSTTKKENVMSASYKNRTVKKQIAIPNNLAKSSAATKPNESSTATKATSARKNYSVKKENVMSASKERTTAKTQTGIQNSTAAKSTAAIKSTVSTKAGNNPKNSSAKKQNTTSTSKSLKSTVAKKPKNARGIAKTQGSTATAAGRNKSAEKISASSTASRTVNKKTGPNSTRSGRSGKDAGTRSQNAKKTGRNESTGKPAAGVSQGTASVHRSAITTGASRSRSGKVPTIDKEMEFHHDSATPKGGVKTGRDIKTARGANRTISDTSIQKKSTDGSGDKINSRQGSATTAARTNDVPAKAQPTASTVNRARARNAGNSGKTK